MPVGYPNLFGASPDPVLTTGRQSHCRNAPNLEMSRKQYIKIIARDADDNTGDFPRHSCYPAVLGSGFRLSVSMPQACTSTTTRHRSSAQLSLVTDLY